MPGRKNLHASAGRPAPRIANLVADPARNPNRSVLDPQRPPLAVELQLDRPLQCLPVLLQRGVKLLGQVRSGSNQQCTHRFSPSRSNGGATRWIGS